MLPGAQAGRPATGPAPGKSLQSPPPGGPKGQRADEAPPAPAAPKPKPRLRLVKVNGKFVTVEDPKLF